MCRYNYSKSKYYELISPPTTGHLCPLALSSVPVGFTFCEKKETVLTIYDFICFIREHYRYIETFYVVELNHIHFTTFQNIMNYYMDP